MGAAHFSVTSNANRDNNFYVSKEDTRVEGPYKDDDKKPTYIPRQIREVQDLYTWQKQVVASATEWDTRHINIVYDKIGNIGKSILATYVSVMGIGEALPPLNDYKDLMRIIMDMEKKPLYIIDMPRAMRKERLFSFFTGVESIKSGYCFDDRYKFRKEHFDCPNIWVFTNFLPELAMLSKDRWVFWGIAHSMRAQGKDIELFKLDYNDIVRAQSKTDQAPMDQTILYDT